MGGELFQVDAKTQLLTIPVEGKRYAVQKGAEKIVCRGHLNLGKMTVTFEDIFRELKAKISHDGYGKFEYTQ